MVHTSSTQTTKKFGSTLTNLQTSTDTLIHLLPITTENYTTYHLT